MTTRRLASRRLRPLLAAVLACAAIMPAAAHAAQVPSVPAGRVAEVRVLVDGRPSNEVVVVRLVEAAKGQVLSPSAVRESIAHLMALGRFDDVEARVDAAPGGLTLTFEATSARRVTRLAFRGDLGVASNDLRAAVIERYTTSPPLARADDIARALGMLCRDHGFMGARVAAHVEPAAEPDRATLAFEIQAGPRVRAGGLAVTGEAGMAASQVLERCGLKSGQPFDPVAVRGKAADLAGTFRGQGYFEAAVTPAFTFSPDGATADVNVAVNRGPLVTLVFKGGPLPSSREAELVPIRREGSVDEDLLEDSERNIENYFHAQGYRDAKAPYSRDLSDGLLKIVFDVQRGPQYRVGALAVSGNSHLPAADIQAGLRSQPGVQYVQSQRDADVATVAERYRRLGFTSVKITPVEQIALKPDTPTEALVNIRLDIVEGPRTMIGEVAFSGNSKVGVPELRALVQSVTGRPFYAPDLERDRHAVLGEYLNRGYQAATVETPTVFSEDRLAVAVTFLISEGPQILVDHVLIVGNSRTRTETIERELLVKQGQPLSSNDLVESQQRLVALGLFRRVSVTELQRGSETTRDVLVTIEEAPPTTFSYGGGVEGSRRLLREGPGGNETVEKFEFAPRGFFDVGRRNLWGKNRTINFFARLSVRPTDPAPVSSAPDAVWVGGGVGISDYRVQLNYREPRVFNNRTDFTATGLAEQGYRSSFDYIRQLGRAELLHRFTLGPTPPVTVSGSFTVENTRLFNERFNQQDKLLIDRAFPQVRLSILGSTIARDTRDDALDPSIGSLTSLNGQLAGKFLGSEVGFIKMFAQGFIYRKLPGTRRVVFAGGGRVGLARGFGIETPVLDANGNPVIGPNGQPLTIIDDNLPASERFYAGGDTTVRAFTTDRLGTPATIDSDGFPHGGLGMLIFNGEFRISVWRWLGAVAFVDVGNVFFRVSDIRVGELRPALGGGLRFRWPLLPLIRVDVGYNPYPRTFQNGGREKSYAVYVGIGQAF